MSRPAILAREHVRARKLVIESHLRLVDDDQATIERLGNLAAFALHMRDYAAVLVRQARAEGHSWSEIGAVLGLTKDGARRRYS